MDDLYSNRTLTAFFDERANAEDAMTRLRTLGITDTSLRLTGGEQYGERTGEDKGFFESLSDFFFPEEDHAVYAEGLRRGGYLLTVSNISADQYDRALDILDDEGSVDIDERARSWRSEGWSDQGAGSSAAMGSSTYAGAESSASDIHGEEEVIPVVEERLRIGKRDASHGRVRVRSYVVEEPVSEEVRLREDHVEIERRPVDRELSGTERAFTDRMIEAEEHVEEAVVSKDARVTEEIGLRKESHERTETVSDTVRHTEVEVEDERDIDRGTTAYPSR